VSVVLCKTTNAGAPQDPSRNDVLQADFHNEGGPGGSVFSFLLRRVLSSNDMAIPEPVVDVHDLGLGSVTVEPTLSAIQCVADAAYAASFLSL